jgi:SAM-dependent methyltransferase
MDEGAPAEYVRDRPIDAIRTSDPWRPFAHYIAVLSATLEDLSRDLGVAPGGRVLDFGCADRPYTDWFEDRVEVVGADLPGNPLATVHVGPDGRVPCPDASFDAVLSTQVLEHVADPALYLRECERLLRPGGRLLLSTHGIFYFHPDPVDYWRWTCQGLQHVVEEAGLQVVRLEGIYGMGATGVQLAVDALLPKLPNRLRGAALRLSHSVIQRVDRRQSAESKRLNASVFALVAEKPR